MNTHNFFQLYLDVGETPNMSEFPVGTILAYSGELVAGTEHLVHGAGLTREQLGMYDENVVREFKADTVVRINTLDLEDTEKLVSHAIDCGGNMQARYIDGTLVIWTTEALASLISRDILQACKWNLVLLTADSVHGMSLEDFKALWFSKVRVETGFDFDREELEFIADGKDITVRIPNLDVSVTYTFDSKYDPDAETDLEEGGTGIYHHETDFVFASVSKAIYAGAESLGEQINAE